MVPPGVSVSAERTYQPPCVGILEGSARWGRRKRAALDAMSLWPVAIHDQPPTDDAVPYQRELRTRL